MLCVVAASSKDSHMATYTKGKWFCLSTTSMEIAHVIAVRLCAIPCWPVRVDDSRTAVNQKLGQVREAAEELMPHHQRTDGISSRVSRKGKALVEKYQDKDGLSRKELDEMLIDTEEFTAIADKAVQHYNLSTKHVLHLGNVMRETIKSTDKHSYNRIPKVNTLW